MGKTNTFLNPKENDGHLSIWRRYEQYGREKDRNSALNTFASVGYFSGLSWAASSSKLREGGAVQLHYNDIQSQFIQALSNGLWIANPPHRGVAALSLRPQSQHTLTTIDPTKSEGSGPQRCAARRWTLGSSEKNALQCWCYEQRVKVFCYLEGPVLKRLEKKSEVTRFNFIKGIKGEHSYDCMGSPWL